MSLRRTAAVAACLLLAALLAPPLGGVASAQEADDTLFIEKDDEVLDGAAVAIALSQATPTGIGGRVVVARDDDFADALASGVMQAESPLLLVDPDALQPAVADHLEALAPAEVVVLGGEHAVSDEVVAELEGDGYAVSRRQGPSRFETATAIAASEAPDATTAILVRAFATEGADDPTQAFADSLAAGGWAAETGWPVLLTQTEVLSEATRAYIADSAIESVRIVGGTAAVSAAVEDALLDLGVDVERVAGASRAETALEIAKERGADSAADVARVVLVDGESPDAWTGGFAAAAHSAAYDAPIVLGRDTGLPAVTTAWLEAGADGGGAAFAQVPEDPEGIRLTCVVDAGVCRLARDVLDLPVIEGLLLAGSCPTFAEAQLSRDGTTVVVPVDHGCSALDVDDPSIAFVDARTGIADVVPLPVPGFGTEQTLTASGDGSVAGITVHGDDGGVDAYAVGRDGSVVHVNPQVGALLAGGAERSMTADGGSWLLFLNGAEQCLNACHHRYDLATGEAVPLQYCGGGDVSVCSSAVVSPGGGHVLYAGFDGRATWTAIRDDGTGVPATVPLPTGSTACTGIDVAATGEALVDCDGRALRVDFAAGAVTPLPATQPRSWTSDGGVATGLDRVVDVASGVHAAVGVPDARPWVADTLVAVAAGPDGLVLVDAAARLAAAAAVG